MGATAIKKIADMPADEIEENDFMPMTALPKLVDEHRTEEVAVYVSQMVGEMAVMARAARLDLLAYFLEMARIEANAHSGKITEPH